MVGVPGGVWLTGVAQYSSTHSNLSKDKKKRRAFLLQNTSMSLRAFVAGMGGFRRKQMLRLLIHVKKNNNPIARNICR